MARPSTVKHSPRRISRGLVVRLPGNGPDEVVRGVSIVLHMANGQDVVYGEEDEVLVLADQPKLLEEQVLVSPGDPATPEE